MLNCIQRHSRLSLVPILASIIVATACAARGPRILATTILEVAGRTEGELMTLSIDRDVEMPPIGAMGMLTLSRDVGETESQFLGIPILVGITNTSCLATVEVVHGSDRRLTVRIMDEEISRLTNDGQGGYMLQGPDGAGALDRGDANLHIGFSLEVGISAADSRDSLLQPPEVASVGVDSQRHHVRMRWIRRKPCQNREFSGRH